MRYRIIHNVPGRLRIQLSVPRRPIPDSARIENLFSSIAGVKAVSYNYRTGNLFIEYSGEGTKAALLSAAGGAEVPFSRRKRERSALEKKKKAAMLSGSLLLARPFIPLPLRPLITFSGALPVFRKGLNSLFSRRLNVDVLDASAIAVAMGTGELFTAGVISFLLKISDYLEEWTRHRSRESLSKMFYYSEQTVWVRRNGTEQRLSAKHLVPGDHVVVRSGSTIPVDGIVVEGEAMVNQSSLTGESLPVMKREGVMVYAGTAVGEGKLVVEAQKTGDETRVSRIVTVIEESEGLKAEVQSHAERLSDRIVPYSFLLSGLTYALTGNPAKAASVLLVDYSCAIKLSTPLTIMSAMMNASRRGVLIKGGKFIEKLAAADTFVLDKTGTLTEARPRVVDVLSLNGYSREYILKHTACVEEHFPHPVATAITRKAEDESLVHEEEHAEVEYIVAHGIASRIGGRRILVGSRHFIHEDNGISVASAEPAVRKLSDRGSSILYVAIGDELAGIITIDDPLRDDSRRFLHLLKGAGVERVVMLTGDNETAARSVAERLGIQDYQWEVFPDTKTDIIKGLKNRGHVVAMVGDGINDSPALSHADVGISMKHGADIAREACDVLLLDGRLEAVFDAITIAQGAMFRIKKNFQRIIGTNSVLLGLGLLGTIPPVFSAFVHNAATIIVAVRSLRPFMVDESGATVHGMCAQSRLPAVTLDRRGISVAIQKPNVRKLLFHSRKEVSLWERKR
ncbi:MAG: heavy metal translocating P-type ATPase [Alphaproteobacteria bacterium]|uniref:P-type Zn(2+) transporter n=1 Tax=Candidatus Nitrobium versatile TaxID=2884831 RepID=A0A953JBT4_9BACT|nr:heavy metal translocating P-type ATPase [Candidatus Nitrobium versatile]